MKGLLERLREWADDFDEAAHKVPGVLARYRNWKARRRAAKEQAEFTDGFEWCMSAYWLEDLYLEDIECHVEDSSDPFDRGALYAVNLIKALLI